VKEVFNPVESNQAIARSIAYQEYCADNLISYDMADAALVQIYREWKQDKQAIDLRRKHSSTTNVGMAFEMYFNLVQPLPQPAIARYTNDKQTNLYDCCLQSVKVSRCFDESTARWLCYTLLARQHGVTYKQARKAVLAQAKQS
jgi:hypothetical protein